MTSYLHLRVALGQLSPEGEVCQLRLDRLLALGTADCSLAIGHARANSAQLRASRLIVLVLRRVGRLRLGRLLAIGTAGCLLQSVMPGRTRPSCSPIGPSLSRQVVFAWVNLPGYQSLDRSSQGLRIEAQDWRKDIT